MANKVTIPTKVITGVNTRWSYANVWDPKSINGGAPKYSVSLIIPKSDTATVAKIVVRQIICTYILHIKCACISDGMDKHSKFLHLFAQLI